MPKDAPPALPSPTDAGYQPGWGDYKERYLCEGAVYFGYRGGCIDFQDKSLSAKLTTKLVNWIHGETFIGKMKKSDWIDFCKLSLAFVGAAGCGATVAACFGVEFITIGGTTVPCVVASALVCTGHGTMLTYLFDKCPELMSYR